MSHTVLVKISIGCLCHRMAQATLVRFLFSHLCLLSSLHVMRLCLYIHNFLLLGLAIFLVVMFYVRYLHFCTTWLRTVVEDQSFRLKAHRLKDFLHIRGWLISKVSPWFLLNQGDMGMFHLLLYTFAYIIFMTLTSKFDCEVRWRHGESTASHSASASIPMTCLLSATRVYVLGPTMISCIRLYYAIFQTVLQQLSDGINMYP